MLTRIVTMSWNIHPYYWTFVPVVFFFYVATHGSETQYITMWLMLQFCSWWRPSWSKRSTIKPTCYEKCSKYTSRDSISPLHLYLFLWKILVLPVRSVGTACGRCWRDPYESITRGWYGFSLHKESGFVKSPLVFSVFINNTVREEENLQYKAEYS